MCPVNQKFPMKKIVLDSLNKKGLSVKLYGSGNAGLKIVNHIYKYLKYA